MSLKKCFLVSFLISLFIVSIMCVNFSKDYTYDVNNNRTSEVVKLNFNTSDINLDKLFTPNDNAHYLSDIIDFTSQWLNLKIDNSHSQTIRFSLYIFLATFIIFNFSLIPYCYYRFWNWILKDKTTRMRV